jgi:hypothetical protein
MAITTQFLSQCTDEQINKGVAWLEISKSALLGKDCEVKLFLMLGMYDPCSDTDFSWPIIFGNDISIQADHIGNGVWFASDLMDMTIANKNPLRAAMEVYILMSVSK